MSDMHTGDAGTARRRALAVRLGLAAALVTALAASVLLAPYRAASRLQAAAQAGDAARLHDLVDYSAYRASLERLAHARIERAAAGEDRLENPYQVFGTTMAVVYALTAADRLVESAVSPAGIATLLRGEPPADPAGDAAAAPRATDPRSAGGSRVRVVRYESPSRFVARFVGADGVAAPLTLVWQRSRTTWRLSEVRLEGC